MPSKRNITNKYVEITITSAIYNTIYVYRTTFKGIARTTAEDVILEPKEMQENSEFVEATLMYHLDR